MLDHSITQQWNLYTFLLTLLKRALTIIWMQQLKKNMVDLQNHDGWQIRLVVTHEVTGEIITTSPSVASQMMDIITWYLSTNEFDGILQETEPICSLQEKSLNVKTATFSQSQSHHFHKIIQFIETAYTQNSRKERKWRLSKSSWRKSQVICNHKFAPIARLNKAHSPFSAAHCHKTICIQALIGGMRGFTQPGRLVHQNLLNWWQ